MMFTVYMVQGETDATDFSSVYKENDESQIHQKNKCKKKNVRLIL